MKLFKCISKISKLLRTYYKPKRPTGAAAKPEPASMHLVYPTPEDTAYTILLSGSALNEELFPYVNIPAPLAPHRDVTRLVSMRRWDLPSILEDEDEDQEPMQEVRAARASDATTTPADAACRVVWWVAYPAARSMAQN